MNKPPMIVVAGPTASGKTALSIRLAKAFSGEIISADSMQVYRGMDIGTAKVRPEEMSGIPHHMIDILEPEESCSVFTFSKMAREAADRVLSAGHVPILAGGTGFYIHAVLYGAEFSEDSGSASVRASLEQELLEKGPEAMHRILSECDPESARAIHPNNTKRVLRALEFYRLTGRKISEDNRIQREKPSPYRFLLLVLSMDRKKLYDRIDQRVDLMMEEGLLEEMRRLKDRGLTERDVSMQALGYKQLFPVLSGEVPLSEAVRQIKTETRHFAKRQLTWFRREPLAVWLSLEDFGGDVERMYLAAEELCRKFLEAPEETAEEDRGTI